MERGRRAIAIVGCSLVLVLVVLGTSRSGPPSTSLAQTEQLWNPETYYNVFGGGEVVGPEWSNSKIRTELHKVILAFSSLAKVTGDNNGAIQADLDSLKNQQVKDVSSVQSEVTTLTQSQQQSQDLWQQFEVALAQAQQKEQQDMAALSQQLTATLNSIQVQQSGTQQSRAGAFDGARADVAAAKAVLADIEKAQQAVKDLANVASSKYGSINKAYKDAESVRKNVADAIKSAEDAIKSATDIATKDIADVSKSVSDAKTTHTVRFSQIGKRLDAVNTALTALTASQNKLHNELVDAAAAAQRQQQAAIADAGSSGSAAAVAAQTKISADLASVQSGINSIFDAVNNNNIEAATRDALSRISDAAAAKGGNNGIKSAQVSAAVDQIKTRLNDVSQMNADTLKQAAALKEVYAALKANSSAEASNLVAAVQSAFSTGAFASNSATRDQITAVQKDIQNLRTTNGNRISALQDLTKQLTTVYNKEVTRIAAETTTLTGVIASASTSLGKALASVSGQIKQASDDDKTLNADNNSKFAQVQTDIENLGKKIATLVRPEGPKGPKGDRGAVGLPGPVGPVGPIGKTGPKGPTGMQGVPGDQGPTGDVGAQGPEGKVGPTGPAGPQGAMGPQGPQGKEGAKGPVGDEGPQGLPGPAGAIGPNGEAGRPGPIGPPGAPGKSS